MYFENKKYVITIIIIIKIKSFLKVLYMYTLLINVAQDVNIF